MTRIAKNNSRVPVTVLFPSATNLRFAAPATNPLVRLQPALMSHTKRDKERPQIFQATESPESRNQVQFRTEQHPGVAGSTGQSGAGASAGHTSEGKRHGATTYSAETWWADGFPRFHVRVLANVPQTEPKPADGASNLSVVWVDSQVSGPCAWCPVDCNCSAQFLYGDRKSFACQKTPPYGLRAGPAPANVCLRIECVNGPHMRLYRAHKRVRRPRSKHASGSLSAFDAGRRPAAQYPGHLMLLEGHHFVVSITAPWDQAERELDGRLRTWSWVKAMSSGQPPVSPARDGARLHARLPVVSPAHRQAFYSDGDEFADHDTDGDAMEHATLQERKLSPEVRTPRGVEPHTAGYPPLLQVNQVLLHITGCALRADQLRPHWEEHFTSMDALRAAVHVWHTPPDAKWFQLNIGEFGKLNLLLCAEVQQ
jgi:hypothetical protein